LNDVRVTWQFAETLFPKIRSLELEKLFWKDMEFLKLVYYTEHLGIILDQGFTLKAQQALLLHTKELEQQLWDAVGYKFNWRSHQVLSKAIYDDLGIEKPKNPYADADGVDRSRFAKGGQYNSTMTSTFLLMEKANHPLGELISALRESSKLKKVCDQWLDLVDDQGVIHSNFNITGTRTGRLSSSKPNLANVPSEVRSRFTQGLYSGGLERSEEYNLRNAFKARPGHWVLSIDYKQQEMRMFAWISQDPVLMKYVKEGKDIHLLIAIAVWGDCGERENKIHREWSKTISFGLLYGMTTGSLEHKLGMDRSQATQVINDYWTTFPRIRPTLFETINECKTNKYLRYWSKRIWREETEHFMYKGLNAKVQGGCSDLLSIAALRTHRWLQENGRGNIISYIYDELLMEVHKQDVEDTANAIAELMQIPDVLDLPFLTECKIGTTYGDTIKMDKIDGRWLLPQEFKEKHNV